MCREIIKVIGKRNVKLSFSGTLNFLGVWRKRHSYIRGTSVHFAAQARHTVHASQ